MSKIAVIIVTHNSRQVIVQCLAALNNQTVRPDSIVIVDSGSTESGYLPSCRSNRITVLKEKNIGFSRANNIGYRTIDPSTDFVLFLNPDALPTANTIEQVIDFLNQNKDVGCVSGRLLGFDCKQQQATNAIDSTGVFRKWYGRWYDRGQGEPDREQYSVQQDVPAVCGAFLFCRKSVLDQVTLADGAVFDPEFFLYKEDIELCLRIRKSGWRIVYLPEIIVYHCRGWQERQRISYPFRLTAAKSELLLYKKHPSPYIFWALVKYFLVRLLWV